MRTRHPVYFHVSGFQHDLLMPIALQRAIYWMNLVLANSGVRRRLEWGGLDARTFYVLDHPTAPDGTPFNDEHAFHVYLFPKPWFETREYGGSFRRSATNDAVCSGWLPRITGDGYDGWWLVAFLLHELGHDRGVAVSPTTEVYKLGPYGGIWSGWEECLLRSPMHGPAWVDGLTYEEMARRNIFAPFESALWNGNYRSGNAPSPITDGWPQITLGNPVPAVPIPGGGWRSVFRAQAELMGMPEREHVDPPAVSELMPWPVDEPTSPKTQLRVKVNDLNRDWWVDVTGCEPGKRYGLFDTRGRYNRNRTRWRLIESREATEGTMGFLAPKAKFKRDRLEVVEVEA